jgi:hypothetical protein
VIRLCVDDCFVPRRGRPHPVLLADPHGQPCYQRPRRRRVSVTGRREAVPGGSMATQGRPGLG